MTASQSMIGTSPIKGLDDGEDFVLVPWEQESGKADRQPAETAGYQPDAQEARQEARSVYQQPEWKEPQAGEDQIAQVNLVMQVEEKPSESFSLRLVEDRQEIGGREPTPGQRRRSSS
jgi:hypothetical protein